MKIEINNSRKFKFNKKLVDKLFKTIGKKFPSYAGDEVSIALVNNQTIQKLNRTYRKINKPTDVLSFAENDDKKKKIKNAYLGEILVSVPYIKKQAIKENNSFDNELMLLLTHGFLHLIGHDHLNKIDDQKMKRQEKIILKKLSSIK